MSRIPFAFILALVSVVAPADEPAVEQAPVFVSGEGGYHTYRIPSLLVTPKGTLLAFCEGRRKSRADSGDIDLLLRRSEDGGRTWGQPQVIWDDGANTCGNPCAVADDGGRIHLLLTHNFGDDNEKEVKAGTGRGTRTVWACRSDDDGVTWTKPREITKDVKRPEWTWYATGPGIGIRIAHGSHAGRLIIPCDHSYHDPEGTRRDVESEYGSHVIYSDDRGETWRLGGAIAPKMNECQVAELADPPGGLLLDMRSYRGRACRAQSTSTDGGLTWTEPRDVPELIEPVCQASLVRHSWPAVEKPGLLLFSNPADLKQRIDLTLRASGDDGRSWSAGLTLNAGRSAYSCLAALPGGSAGCLYERGENDPYEMIVFARVPADVLTDEATDEATDRN
jgi:sialidase-1